MLPVLYYKSTESLTDKYSGNSLVKYDFCFRVQKQRAVVCTLNKDTCFVPRTRDMGGSLEQNHRMLVEAFEKLSYGNNEKFCLLAESS